jgi:hypothetical protein
MGFPDSLAYCLTQLEPDGKPAEPYPGLARIIALTGKTLRE